MGLHWSFGCSTLNCHWVEKCRAAMFQTHCSHLSFARVKLLPQQRLKAVALVQKVEDVGHLVVPGDARQQAHLRTENENTTEGNN